MKIVLLVSEFLPVIGGIGSYARELANAGSRLGHEMIVVAPSYGKDNSDLDHGFPYKLIRYSGGRHSMRDMIPKVKLMFQLRSLLKDADVVHAVDWPFYIPLRVVSYFIPSRIGRYYTYHGTEINYMHSPARRVALTILTFWSRGSIFITNSTFTKEILYKTFPQAKRIETRAIPLGVNLPEYSFDRSFARQSLAISDKEFVILTVGRLVRRKGHLILAKALYKLSRSYAVRIRWVICGPDGDQLYMNELEQALSVLSVNCERAGAVSDKNLALYYAAADLFCLTSEISSAGEVEGFGLVYLEAAVHGVPALGTRVGGIPDAVIDGKTGVLIPPGDLNAIANELVLLMDDPSRLQYLGTNARKHAISENWDSVFKKTYLI